MILKSLALACAFLLGAGFGPYRANILRVIDGDTLEVETRIWPGLTQRTMLRIGSINTPERRGPACEVSAAAEATRFVEEWVFKGREFTVVLAGEDKYGRALGDIAREDGVYLSAALLAAKLARRYTGGKREPWC